MEGTQAEMGRFCRVWKGLGEERGMRLTDREECKNRKGMRRNRKQTSGIRLES